MKADPIAGLIALSLRHRLAVLILTALMAVAGAWSFGTLPMDAFPDTTPVQVQVNTVAPALGAEQVERQVTFPIEQVLRGLPGLLGERSLSRFGLSQVTLVFDDSVDLYRARQVVSERLIGLDLPAHALRPALGPAATGLGEVFQYLVVGRGRSLAELRAVHDRLIRPHLLAARGVAEVNAWGGDVRRVEVRADPTELARRGMSLQELADALAASYGAAGGGRLVRAGEATLVQGVSALTSLDDVESVVVRAEGGVAVRVRDVARVTDGAELRHGAVTADGRGEVVLGIGFMLNGENSREVSSRLREAVEAVRPTLPPGISVEVVYERRALVDQVLDTVRDNLLEGALLVAVVLLVFLGELRAGLVVASVIPLSMLFAFSAMHAAGVTVSLMSLGAIDFGLVVDSAIISVENAARRAGEQWPERPMLDIVRDAALEVRRPTLFGELIIAIVYLPVLTLSGVEGKLFRPMALTVLFALAGSMALSLTYVPVMASLVIAPQGHRRDPALLAWLKRGYRRVLDVSLRRRAAVLAVAAVVLASGAVVAAGLGTEFIPRLSEGTIAVEAVHLASIDLDEAVRYGTRVEMALRDAFPDEVARVWTRNGTGEVATDPMGPEQADIFVSLRPMSRWRRAHTHDALVRAMQQELAPMPGLRLSFSQPIENRMREITSGVRAEVAVKVYGDDLAVLQQLGDRIAAALRAVPGAADVSVSQVTGLPLLRVEVDHPAASRYGISAARVLQTVAALSGTDVAELRDGPWSVPIALRIDPARARDAAAVGRLLVTAPDGTQVPLSRLARITQAEGPSRIDRERARRRVVVQANVRGRDLGSFVAAARARIGRDVRLPVGYQTEMGGEFEHLERARTRLLWVVPLALGLVFSLLYATYGRARDALRVFAAVPFAAVGGAVALSLRAMPVSISAAVGFIAVSGVAVLGDMVFASAVRRELDQGVEVFAAIRASAIERLRPVLMTALVAALGFVPMATSRGVGAEVQRPLATVVIGGLVSSTLLTLVVLPALYSFVAPTPGRTETAAPTE